MAARQLGKFMTRSCSSAASNTAKEIAKTSFKYKLSKWAYNQCEFRKLGLHVDDSLKATPLMKEALHRLNQVDQKAYDERNFRMIRALQLSGSKTVLPEDEWTQFDEDVRYLRPLMDQILKETAERKEWNNQ